MEEKNPLDEANRIIGNSGLNEDVRDGIEAVVKIHKKLLGI